jgi:hypothetical protein
VYTISTKCYNDSITAKSPLNVREIQYKT